MMQPGKFSSAERLLVRSLPCQLGRYTVVEHFARGGMADIHLARTPDGQLVVIKEVFPELRSSARFSELLVGEAELVGMLRHPNIVRVLGLGFGLSGDAENTRQPFIAFEYVEGIDLRFLLRQCTKRALALPIAYSLNLVCDVLRALEHAHRARGEGGERLRIVHRDVSPSNVLLSFDGQVKLCDFGIAMASTMPAVPIRTIEGKAGYMSPEHARGECVDARSDVYAAGIMLWELLSGRRMYRRKGQSLLKVAARAEVPMIVVRGLPREQELHTIVRKALAEEPAERFQTAGAMLRELETYCEAVGMDRSSFALGSWLNEHFGAERAEREQARERVLSTAPLSSEMSSAIETVPFEKLVGGAGPRSMRVRRRRHLEVVPLVKLGLGSAGATLGSLLALSGLGLI